MYIRVHIPFNFGPCVCVYMCACVCVCVCACVMCDVSCRRACFSQLTGFILYFVGANSSCHLIREVFKIDKKKKWNRRLCEGMNGIFLELNLSSVLSFFKTFCRRQSMQGPTQSAQVTKSLQIPLINGRVVLQPTPRSSAPDSRNKRKNLRVVLTVWPDLSETFDKHCGQHANLDKKSPFFLTKHTHTHNCVDDKLESDCLFSFASVSCSWPKFWYSQPNMADSFWAGCNPSHLPYCSVICGEFKQSIPL